jgi:hypothetical protein
MFNRGGYVGISLRKGKRHAISHARILAGFGIALT